MPRIKCPLHGYQATKLVSPDLWENPESALEKGKIVKYSWIYLGKIYATFIVSQDFAFNHSVDDGVWELPDFIAELQMKVLKEIKLVCSKCYDERLIRLINQA